MLSNLVAFVCSCYFSATLQVILRDPIISSALQRSFTDVAMMESSTVWSILQRICYLTSQGRYLFLAQPILDMLRREQTSFLTLDAFGNQALVQDQHSWADAFEALLQLLLTTTAPRYKVATQHLLIALRRAISTAGRCCMLT